MAQEKNINEEIQKVLGNGWELVDAQLKGKPDSQRVKAFKKTVVVSLEEAMRVNERPEYIEVEVEDENQDTLNFPQRN